MIAEHTQGRGNRRLHPVRIAGWGLAALLILAPLVAMRFTDEVDWSPADFVFAAILLGTTGLGIELLVRKSRSAAYRFGAVAAILTAFLTIWVNGAVGMIGDEGNSYNLLFLGLLVAVLIGALLSRFTPAGMARTMAGAALGQAVIAAGGFAADPRGAMFSLVFALFWLSAAALFRKAQRETQAPAP